MKVFAFRGEKPNTRFCNEIRFTDLKHLNIVNFVHWEKEKEMIQKGTSNKSSYILMEYASHGDLFKFILDYKDQIDEKLVRTYFRQLIDGIEYLHENGMAHLDIKPENLLIGNDYNLKIIDFDLSYLQNDPEIASHGTKCYRPPEFFRSNSTVLNLKSTFAADIYVILFLFKSGGYYPHAEDDGEDEGRFLYWMYADNNAFWGRHCQMEKRASSFYNKNFKELFNNMVKERPTERSNIKQIKESKWYHGPVYSQIELSDKMKELFDHQAF